MTSVSSEISEVTSSWFAEEEYLGMKWGGGEINRKVNSRQAGQYVPYIYIYNILILGAINTIHTRDNTWWMT